MKRHFSKLAVLLPAAGMLILLINPTVAITGASKGLELCLRSVIPALLPMFVLSSLLTNALPQKKNAVFTLIGKICALPKGQESLFLIGLLSGYPVGARSVYQAYKTNRISGNSARRMLGFCSNAGPSFIFGVTAALFSRHYIPWCLWGIHMISAILTGVLLPGNVEDGRPIARTQRLTLQEALAQSSESLIHVCGWVILFRTAIEILKHNVLFMLPNSIIVSIIGLLELTNGCIALTTIPEEGIRFILCSGFLSIGGVCVLMQTVSATKELGLGSYIYGKLLQGTISTLIAMLFQPVLFAKEGVSLPIGGLLLIILFLIGLILISQRQKKRSSFFSKNYV